MKVIKGVVECGFGIVCYIAIAIVLNTLGADVTTWQYWAVLVLVFILDVGRMVQRYGV